MVSGYSEQDLASMDGPRDLKERGSVAWSWQTVSAMQHMWQSLYLNYEHYMGILAEAQEYRIWENIPPDNPYGSESNMLKQVEVGTVKDAHNRMRTQTLAAQTRQILQQHGRQIEREELKGDHDNLESPRRLTSSEYIMRLIAKENPEFAEKIASGEVVFANARQAARAAGVFLPARKPSVNLSDNVERVADKLKSYYSPEQVKRIIEWLAQETEETNQAENK